MVYFVLQLISHPCIIRAMQRSTDTQAAFWALLILCFWLSVVPAEPPCISWIMKAPFIYWSVCLHWPMLLPAMLFPHATDIYLDVETHLLIITTPKWKMDVGDGKFTLRNHQILSQLSAIWLITYGLSYITHSRGAVCSKSTLKK